MKKYYQFAFLILFVFIQFNVFAQSRNASPYCYPHAYNMVDGTCTNSDTIDYWGDGFSFVIVKLNTIDQSSGCYGSSDSDAYRYWNKSTSLNINSTYTLTATMPRNSKGHIAALGFWIDYNQNNSFEANERVNSMLYNNKGEGTMELRLSFKVPCSADTGLTRLRLRVQPDKAINGGDSCNNIYNGMGETWDFNVNIRPMPMPIADFTFPSIIYTKQKITLNATDKTALNYAWDINNDGSFEQTGANTTSLYTWTTGGTKCVKLRVSNCTGSDSITKCFNLIAPTSVPVANFKTANRVIAIYETVKLNDKSTNGPWQYEWDVYDSVTYAGIGFYPCLLSGEVYPDPSGDGSDQYSANPEFSFDVPGCYTVRLKVKNDVGFSPVTVKTCYIRVIDQTDTSQGIAGHVYQDMNNNCSFDVNDRKLGNILIGFDDTANEVKHRWYTSDGRYNVNLDTGNYNVFIDYTGMPVVAQCAQSLDTNIVLNTNNRRVEGVDFAIECDQTFDVKIDHVLVLGRVFPSLTHTLRSRIFERGAKYGLVCKNNINATVKIDIGGKVKFLTAEYGAAIPDSVNGNVLFYNISNFENITDDKYFSVLLEVDTTANIGDSVTVKIDILNMSPDADTSNNHYQTQYQIRNSYDPNFKEVSREIVEPLYDDWLYYTVHFQNTGNESAINIRMMDTLDSKLDPESLDILGYSHHMNAIVRGQIINFQFPNIDLPDSFSNEAGSHGYVQYKVRPKAKYPDGTKISNTAFIYFDFNAPVVTNTIQTSYVKKNSSISNVSKQNYLIVYPNPSNEKFNMMLQDQSSAQWMVIDVYGKSIANGDIDGTAILDLSGFSKGIYFLKVYNGSFEDVQCIVLE